MAEKWEYHTTILFADAEQRRDFLEGRWPDWRPHTSVSASERGPGTVAPGPDSKRLDVCQRRPRRLT